jgi:hypothetical protein
MARYATREDHPDCEGVAVVADDDPDIVVSCHDTVEEALTAIIALLDADDDEAEPPEEPAEMPAGGPPAAGVRFRSVLALAASWPSSASATGNSPSPCRTRRSTPGLTRPAASSAARSSRPVRSAVS